MSKEDPDRAARLAEALRTNLRRRKAQARAQESAAEQGDGMKLGDATPMERPPR